MSTTVDERVVEMRFDNKHFEKNVETTMSSLDKLKQSLNLQGATKGLENVGTAAKKIDMSGLTNAVETVHARFSALQIMGITALTNITNSAVNAGKKIVSALTIDPIKTGLSEYETQINAVQTILANTSSKGTTLDQVNTALDTLNTYADKTIYNFTEMTRNIGTFTAAGIDLDTSVSAIQGIANLAAVSGSTSQQASTAMYQLSQALSSGTVKLQDWNSVVNAGMGGQVFQDALKRTATIMGTNVDKLIEKNGSFRESLTEGWITAEVLTETLNQFTLAAEEGTAQWDEYKKSLTDKGYSEEQAVEILKMANTATNAATKVKTLTQLWDTLQESVQSGWTQSWEILVGDFEEAKTLFTGISDALGAMIGESSDARNEVLQGWKDLGGRTALIEALGNTFRGIMSVINPVIEAFREIFPPTTAKQLFAITESFKFLSMGFELSSVEAGKLKRAFKGVFAIVDIGVQIVSAIAGGFMDLLKYIAPAGSGLLDFSASLGDTLVNFNEFLKTSEVFKVVVDKITGVVIIAADHVKKFVSGIVDGIKSIANVDTSGVEALSEKIKLRFEPLSAIGEGVKKVFNGIAAVLKKVAPIFYALASKVGEAFKGMSEKIATSIQNSDFNSLLDIFNVLITGGIGLGIKKFVDSLTSVTDGAGGFLEGLTDILDGVKGSLEAWQASLKAKTLLTIASAIGILAAALIALSLIDSNKMTIALAAITGLFADLVVAMRLFSSTLDAKGSKGMTTMTAAMVGMSVAILVLSFAMSKLAKLDLDGIVNGLIGIAGLSAILVKSAKSLSGSSKPLIKGATGLVVFAAAILVLSEAVEKLGSLDIATLTKGLVGVGVLCAELALFLKVANFDGIGPMKGVGMIALAAAVNILASAVEKFGTLDVTSLIKGLGAVGIVLVELAAFSILTGNAKHVFSTAVSMTILGAAMLIFAKAVGNMGSLGWEQIGKGLVTMAGSLALVTIAMNLLPKNMIGASIGMIGVATALILIGKAMGSMGSLSWEQIGKGLVTMLGSLILVVGAANLMSGAVSGAAAMLIFAGALTILAPVLKSLGEMSLGEIGKALLTLAGVFGVLGLAALVFGPLTPVIIGFSGALALLGVACVTIGAGVLALSAGLAALAVSGTAGAAALVVVITSIVGLIPVVLEQIGNGVIAFAKVIAEGGPAICEAVTAVLIALIEAINECVPPLLECLGNLVIKLLDFLIEYGPKFIDLGFTLLLSLLQGIADNIQQVVEIATDIIVNFLNGITNSIPKIIQAGIDLMLGFINGMADGIRNNTDATISAVNNLMDAIIGAVIAWFANIFTRGKELVSKLAEGISNSIAKAKEAASNLISKVVSSITGKAKDFKNAASDLISGFVNGIKDGVANAVKAAKEMASNVVDGVKNFLGIHSPSRVFKNEVGRWVVEGLAEGITKTMSAEEAAAKKASNVTNAFKSEYDKLDGLDKKIDLEMKLYGGDEAVVYAEKYARQLERVSLAQGKYDTLLAELGADAIETQTAYNELLQENVDLQALATDEMTRRKNAIEDAASSQYDKLDLDDKTASLEFELYGGDEAIVYAEKRIKQIDRIRIAQEKYNSTVELFGKDAVESQTAYNNLLQENIDLKKLDQEETERLNELEEKKFQHSLDWIDEKKDANELSLFDELAAYKRVQSRYEEGTERRIQADKEVARLQKEIAEANEDYYKEVEDIHEDYTERKKELDKEYYDTVTAYNEKLERDIKDVWASYDDAVKSRADSIYGAYGLFDAVGTSEAVDGTTLIDNLQGQVDAIEDWKKDIQSLSKKGLADGLMEELQAMGPSSAAQIKALNSLSRTELNKYEKLWKEKQSSAREQAKFELRGLRLDSLAEVRKLELETEHELNQYRADWGTQMNQLKTDTDTQLANAKASWLETLKISDPEKDSVKSEFTTMVDEITTEIGTDAGWSEAGANAVAGIIQGITLNSGYLTSTVASMMAGVLTTAYATWDIHSPSREFAKIGKFGILGLAKGIVNNSKTVMDAVKDVGNEAVSGMSNSIARIVDIVNNDLDTQPTIRPVLDLSDVESKAGRLNAMFSREQAVTISGSRSKSSIGDSQSESKSSSGGDTYTFTQNNYSPKALSKTDIYRQTKNQFSAMKRTVKT